MTPLQLHRELLRLRRSEELLASLYLRQEMRTPTHFGIGQEAIAVGVCAALNLPNDVVVTHHRSHNAYLACNGSYEALVAELYGRVTGCSKGRGGSVHLTSRHTGLLASSAILGEMIAVATGAAWAFKMTGENRVAVCFFGEGAADEGILYESMNFASLNKLPVLFVCENNLYATESPLSARMAPDADLIDRADAFGVVPFKVDGNDVGAVYKTTQLALQHVRSGQPCFLECSTYRWLEHVGPNYDHESGRTYRTKEELDEWRQRDPIRISALKLTVAEYRLLDVINAAIQVELKAAADRAYAAPKPDRSTLFENVW